jgi:mRNA interferase MazF
MVRGEVWWASLGAPSASEPGYRRPVLVIQSDLFNQSAIRTVICLAVTTNLDLGRAPGNVLLRAKASGLPRDSVVNVSQIITADRSFLTERLGSVPRAILQEVELGLRLVLGLA